MEFQNVDITRQARGAMDKLLEAARVEPGGIVVVGCSTSEVLGRHIGTAGNLEVANAILEGICPAAEAAQVFLAVQCCEHLNRALVIERECAKAYGCEPVCVMPAPKAGGALAAAAMRRFNAPVIVEHIRAGAGMDIGDTLIGMHLKPVAVPLRSEGVEHIGAARVVMAYTRPRYIGGVRAFYGDEER